MAVGIGFAVMRITITVYLDAQFSVSFCSTKHNILFHRGLNKMRTFHI